MEPRLGVSLDTPLTECYDEIESSHSLRRLDAMCI